MWNSGTTTTTTIGFINENNQENMGTRGKSGTARGRLAYKLKCRLCGFEYGSDGTNIAYKKCPSCQNGEEGIEY